ncbi:MAG: carbohydrate ABC transporter permease [Bacilli bacterium]
MENYQTMFNDPIFFVALKNSVLWVVLTTLVEMAIGFFSALLIEAYIVRGRALFRTLLFLPMVVSPSVIAIVFTNLYAPSYGLLFGAFQQLGLAGSFPALLGDPKWATIAVILVNIWQWSGFFVLLYAVGFAQIDPHLIDAAEVDGARGWARIRYIFFPLVRSTHFSLMILGVIQALQQFPLIYLMTQGGPAESTQVLATYIFTQGYVDNNMPYASALSVILLLLAFAIVGIQLMTVRGDFSIGRTNTHA